MKTKRNVQVAEEKTPDPESESKFDKERKGVVKIISQIPKLAPGHKEIQKSEQAIDKPEVSVDRPGSGNLNGESPVLPFSTANIDPGKIALAEKFGIPIGQILSWAQSVEQRLTAIQEQLPTEIGKAIDQAIQKARQEQPKPVAQIPINANNPGGLQMPAWGQALPEIVGMIRDAVKDQPQQTNILQELAMESLKEDISFTKTFKQAIKSKFASAATDEIVSKVVEGH